MHCVELFSLAVEIADCDPLPEPVSVANCAVTGHVCQCVPRDALLGKSFRDQGVLRWPDSGWVSLAVWCAFTYHLDRGKKRAFYPERQSSWLVVDSYWGARLFLLDRQGVRDRVLSSEQAPALWAGYVTTSYKKHGSLYTPINSPGQAIWQWEQTRVDCSDRDLVADTWRVLREAQNAGIPRPCIESLAPYAAQIRKVGVSTWQDFEAWARPRHLSPLYRFLAYLLPSAAALKDAGS